MDDRLLPRPYKLRYIWMAGAVGVLSAAGVALGSVLPWANVQGLWANEAIPGTDGAGGLTLFVATLAILLLLSAMLIPAVSTLLELDPKAALRGLFGASFALGLVCVVVFIYDGTRTFRAVATFHDSLNRASVGAGIYLGIICSLALCEATGRISYRMRTGKA